MQSYGQLMFTPAVAAEQAADGSRDANAKRAERPAPDGLGPDEIAFLESRQSFYMASVSENGWPYVQHRGGPRGFLKVLGPRTIGFADYRGNRQLITKGNLAGDDRVSVFAMDYVRKARLKIQGRATMRMAAGAPTTAQALSTDGEGRVERVVVIEVEAFDWNCPQFITPRFDQAELTALVGPELDRLETKIRELEAENAALKQTLGEQQ